MHTITTAVALLCYSTHLASADEMNGILLRGQSHPDTRELKSENTKKQQFVQSNPVCDFSSDIAQIFTVEPIIYSPQSSNFDAVRTAQFGALYGTAADGDDITSPDWIVKPTTDEQISELMSYIYSCKDDAHPFAVAVRSGGHSYSGLSSCYKDISPGFCIQVDMIEFKDFELVDSSDGSTVEYIRLGPGLTVEEIGDNTFNKSVFVPHGICKKVGVGGHFQTSSIGHWARTVGLGIDHVESFRIVLSDGTIKTVHKGDTEECTSAGVSNSNPNSLYWAALGGNSGSWGIVTEVTLNASRLQNSDYPNSTGVVLDWPYSKDNMLALLGVMVDLTKNPSYFKENDAWPYFVVQPVGEPDTNPFKDFKITLVMTWSGAGFSGSIHDSGRFATLVQPFLDAVEDSTTRNNVVQAPMSAVGAFITADVPPFRFYSNHGGTQSVYSDKWVRGVTDVLDEAVQNPFISLLFQVVEYGGVVIDNADTPWSLNAFPHRSMKHVIDNWIWLNPFADADVAASVGRDFKQQFADVLGIEKYPTLWAASGVSDGSVDMCEDYNQFYQNDAVFSRLQEVKNCVDPKNIFRNHFTIPPTCS